MGPEGACLLGGGPSLRIGGPLFIGGGGPLEDGPLKKGSTRQGHNTGVPLCYHGSL